MQKLGTKITYKPNGEGQTTNAVFAEPTQPISAILGSNDSVEAPPQFICETYLSRRFRSKNSAFWAQKRDFAYEMNASFGAPNV
ncbi:hypothetical protein L596_020143 [Steinernema carpocapsae]|uniref:Uncharacterized protein n=1 Tax=Steinernema carpocapsae TaxID=34508 RepID=A0A4U5MSM7_STECR|nr:hypothetical protein L596_020143 [Steinernema carpocapsae]